MNKLSTLAKALITNATVDINLGDITVRDQIVALGRVSPTRWVVQLRDHGRCIVEAK